MELEPTKRDEKRAWEQKLAAKTKKCANLFDDCAILMLYDVINASRASFPEAKEPQKDDPPCDGGKEDLCRAVVALQDLVSTLIGDKERPPKKDPYESYNFPRLARFFSAQAGAMTNLAGIASTLLISNEEYKGESSLDTMSIDRKGMYEILLTMIETTFTGKDDAPARSWTKDSDGNVMDMTARDAALAELRAALSNGFVKYKTAENNEKSAKWIEEETFFDAPSKWTWLPIEEERELAPSPEAEPLMKAEEVQVKPGTTLACASRTEDERRNGTAIPQTQAVALRDSTVRRLEGEKDSLQNQYDAAERAIAGLRREVEDLRAAQRGIARKRAIVDDGDLGGEFFTFVDERFGGITYEFRFYDKDDKQPNANEIDYMAGQYPESKRNVDPQAWNTWMLRLERAKAAYVEEKRQENSKRARRDRAPKLGR